MPQQAQYEHLRRDSGTGQYYGFTTQGGWTPISPKDAAAAMTAHAQSIVSPPEPEFPEGGFNGPNAIQDSIAFVRAHPKATAAGVEKSNQFLAKEAPYIVGTMATLPFGGEGGSLPLLGRILASAAGGGLGRAMTGGTNKQNIGSAVDLGTLQAGGELLGGLVDFAMKVPDLFRAGLQKSLGVGPKFVEKKEAEAAEDYATKTAQQQSKRAEQVQGTGKKYLNEKAESETANKAASRSEQLRGYLKDKHNKLITSLQSNIQSTHDAVRGALDQRWGALRSKVGDVPVDIAPIQDAIKNAQQNILRGSPESITIFNNILREGEPGIEQASVFHGAGQLGRGEAGVPLGKAGISRSASSLALNPEIRAFFESEAKGSGGEVSFNNARGYYTELGDKMFGGRELPGDVYRALRSVRETIDDQLTKAANKAGAGNQYASLKSDWHAYEEDFRNMKSMAVGGSPIARILKAQDPGFVENPALGKTSQRLMTTMAKYKKFGANPDLLADLRRTDDTIGKLPKLKHVETPARPGVPAKPAPIERANVNARVLQLQQLDKRIEQLQHLSPYELISTAWGLGEMLRGGVPYGFVYPVAKHLMAKALETPAIQDWLLKEVYRRASIGAGAKTLIGVAPAIGVAAASSQNQ